MTEADDWEVCVATLALRTEPPPRLPPPPVAVDALDAELAVMVRVAESDPVSDVSCASVYVNDTVAVDVISNAPSDAT